MGSNCCSANSSTLATSIRQTDYGPIRPTHSPNELQNQSTSKNTMADAIPAIFKLLKKSDTQTYERITEFIKDNELPTFSHYSNSQFQTSSHQEMDKEKKKEQKLDGQQNEAPEKYYFGNFEEGKAQGTGVLYCQNKYCYLGNFHEGVISGEGILYYLHNSQNQEDSSQILEEYVGGFIDGKAHGHGRYTKKNLKNDETYNNNQVDFQGQWLAGTPSSGSAKFGPQSNIRTLVILDIKTREGILEVKDGSKYKGHLNEKLEPEGIGTYSKGDSQYSGGWLMGRFHGFGKFLWENGQFYEGNYSNGKKQGTGKFVFKSGNYYEGNWLNGYQNGRGALYEKGGRVIRKGVWTDGIFQIEIPDEEWQEYKKSILKGIDF